MILDQIIKDRKKEIEALKVTTSISNLEREIGNTQIKYYSFKSALENDKNPLNIIAEVKKASPSKGLICKEFNHIKIAKAYEKGGAAALSVLTESKYFRGCNQYLTEIKEVVNKPVLRKDFIIDPIQIYETKAIGADAILLIVSILSKEALKEYLQIAKYLELDALVETHNEEEVEAALIAGAEIIGVNNRNLKSFEVRLDTSEKLRKLVPKDKVFVAESGIHTIEDVRRLKALDVKAVLIGESLITAQRPEEQLQNFIYA